MENNLFQSRHAHGSYKINHENSWTIGNSSTLTTCTAVQFIEFFCGAHWCLSTRASVSMKTQSLCPAVMPTLDVIFIQVRTQDVWIGPVYVWREDKGKVLPLRNLRCQNGP